MITKYKRQSIGKEKAMALLNGGWWKEKSARKIATFQLFTDELSMPFPVFHQALEDALGRSVWMHELALDFDGIAAELLGERPAPSMEDIINLVPSEKLVVIS